ncbi:MAG TPA: hypothetical protein VMA36_01195 [Candidatus Limnocylindria bacterium]|jgi:hypothetical protein|nr:hypothetical protein [Candidatus Limnocylindria bacterium]
MQLWSRGTRAALALAALCAAIGFAGPASAHDALENFTVDVTPQWYLATNGNASNPQGTTRTTNDVAWNYNVDYRINNGTSLYFNHLNTFYTLGSVYPAPHAAKIYPGITEDYFTNIGISHTFNRYFTGLAGYYHRTRMCCPGDGDPNQTKPLGYGGYFLGGNIRFGPFTSVGPLFIASFQAIEVIHPQLASVAAGVPAGQTYYGDRPILNYSLMFRPPVFGQRRFVPFVSYERPSDFYMNSPVPTFANVMVYGFTEVITKDVVMRGAIRNLVATDNGYPFKGTEVPHYTVIQLGVDYKFHG